MYKCPKCSSEKIRGRFCGSCGYPIPDAPKEPESTECEKHSVTKEFVAAEIERLEKRLKKIPDDTQAYVELIDYLTHTEKYKKAYSAFRAAKAIAPENADILRVGAKLLILMNRRDEAINLLKSIIKFDADDIDSTISLAELYHDSGKKKESLKTLESLEHAAKKRPEILIRMAQINLSIGKADLAQNYLSRYRQVAGATKEMFLMLGETMLIRGFYDGALKNYREAVALFPESCEMHLGLGRSYLGMEDRNHALMELKRAYELDSSNAKVILELGKLQNILGMDEEADKIFQRLEKNKKINGDYFLELAKHFLDRNNPDRAIRYLEIARGLSPFNPEIQKVLGKTFLFQGKFKQAYLLYKEIIEEMPACEWALEGLIESSGHEKDYSLKAEAQKKLLELQPPEPEKWCDYGETLIRLGEYSQAETAFQEAARLDPTSLRAYQAPELIKIEKLRAEGIKLAAQAAEGIKQKLYLSASERLEKALTLVPSQMEWTRLLADISLKTAEVRRASELLAKVRASGSTEYQLSFDLARTYEQEGKIQLAIELLSSVVRDYPLSLDAHLMLLRLKRTQIRGYRAEMEMLDALVRNLDLELAHLRKESHIPLLVKAYANYIFGYQTKFQQEALMRAEKTFLEAIERFGESEDALKGLCLLERIRGNVVKAVSYAKSIVRHSSEPAKLFDLARLHENFQQSGEARKCYISLKSLFPENGLYRQKVVQMTAELSRGGGKNELMSLITENYQAVQNKKETVWLLFETAIAQDLFADFAPEKDEWIKRSLFNWNKIATKPEASPWIKWGAADCQLKRLIGIERQKAATQNLKVCEKILRQQPDDPYAYLAIGKCYMAIDDLSNNDKALDYLQKAWFLDKKNYEIAECIAVTSKKLGKSLIIDSIAHCLILEEPELALTKIFKQ